MFLTFIGFLVNILSKSDIKLILKVGFLLLIPILNSLKNSSQLIMLIFIKFIIEVNVSSIIEFLLIPRLAINFGNKIFPAAEKFFLKPLDNNPIILIPAWCKLRFYSFSNFVTMVTKLSWLEGCSIGVFKSLINFYNMSIFIYQVGVDMT